MAETERSVYVCSNDETSLRRLRPGEPVFEIKIMLKSSLVPGEPFPRKALEEGLLSLEQEHHDRRAEWALLEQYNAIVDKNKA